MSIEFVNEPESRITGQPGLENLIFTASSNEKLSWPQAVSFCAERNSMLQSLPEAACFRCHADGADHSNEQQVTRTAAVYFYKNGRRYIAFDDIADPKKNIILARAECGFRSCRRDGTWLLSMNDKHVKQILARADRDGRIVELTHRHYAPMFYVFGARMAKAILGDMADTYAAFLRRKGFAKIHISCQDSTLENRAHIRPLNLLAANYSYGIGVFYMQLDNCHARGVRAVQNIVEQSKE
jgi:hypothetical protein